MDELTLQIFIFQNFKSLKNLFTTQRQEVKILDIGILNYDAGPDFINSHIILNNVHWFGNIEIHLKSSDWKKHSHSKNNLYDNVILHIVIEQDLQIFKKNNNPLPTLEIKNYLNEFLNNIPSNNKFCNLEKLNEIFPMLILQRMKRKNNFIISLLNNLNGDWEATVFHLLMYNFGFKINNDQMLQLAAAIDYKIIKKNKDDEKNLLAILIGQADLLKFFDEELISRYNFLKQKYNLSEQKIFWKYSKMHPKNFPEIRIQQVVKLIYKKNSLLEWIKNYDEERRNEIFLTEQTLNHIKINIIIPLEFSYNHYYCKPNKYILEKFKNIKTEENKIIRNWKKLGLKIFNSYESQALLELTNSFCKKNKCLMCPLFIEKNFNCLKYDQ